MATLVQNTEHVSEALSRLLEQFKHRPNIEALITALVNQIQDLENVFFDLYLDRWIDSAGGVLLDNLGDIVRQPREGRGDEDYRAWIKARIVSNRSNGNNDDLFLIAELVIGALDNFDLDEQYPAGLVAKVYNYTDSADTLFDILFATKPAGVRFILEHSSSSFDSLFRFAPADEIVEDSGYGFGVGIFAGAEGV